MSDDKAILVATGSVLAEFDGRPLYIHQGVTTVREGHPLLEAFGGHFGPLTPTFEWTEADQAAREQEAAGTPEEEAIPVEAEAVPSEPPGVSDGGSVPPAPDPKDVRAWAAENGIEVSPKGKLPAGVIEQYQAAHTEA
ncbi:histone-like nucleoid-structuring protein Lsr2 [Streptomyces sp. NPDC048663]|uniref:Lsr2 family DNA-binding protein n=1 Tax=Streptomyces sp. NPDC048663 TaxID=3155638 RepID=UPI00344901C5